MQKPNLTLNRVGALRRVFGLRTVQKLPSTVTRYCKPLLRLNTKALPTFSTFHPISTDFYLDSPLLCSPQFNSPLTPRFEGASPVLDIISHQFDPLSPRTSYWSHPMASASQSHPSFPSRPYSSTLHGKNPERASAFGTRDGARLERERQERERLQREAAAAQQAEVTNTINTLSDEQREEINEAVRARLPRTLFL